MTFFEMFGTVALLVPVKNWLSIPLREMYPLSKFGKRSSSTRRNMTDKQNLMIMSILCYQHLRRIAFTKRCVCCLSFVTVPPLEKEMCLIVKDTWLRSCGVTITRGGMFLWRKSSLNGVRLSKFGGCCPWRSKDITNNKHFCHQFWQPPK